MKRTYVFTSYELAPITPGGCGVFILNAVKELLKDPDNRVVLLLDMPLHECRQFTEHYQPHLLHAENLSVECLQEVLSHTNSPVFEHFQNVYMWKSYQFYQGLRQLEKKYLIDYIEFFDYVGIGYYTIKSKKYEGTFANCTLAVRAHCTIDLMDIEQNQADFRYEKIEMYQMEKEAIQNADLLIVPSKSWGEIYSKRYEISPERIYISPPPVFEWDDITYRFDLENKDVLFYGRIFQLKGVDLLVDAAVTFMSRYPENKSRFIFAGYDGVSESGKPFSEEMKQRVPDVFKDRFIFTGQVDRKKLEALLETVRFAVFPNRVESFCYSIHELYNLGVPILCNQIPAFNDFFIDGENALVFDGTVSDLVEKMNLLFTDPNLILRIRKPYPITNSQKFAEDYKTFVGHSKSTPPQFREVKFKLSLIILADSCPQPELSSSLKDLLESGIADPKASYILTSYERGVPLAFLGKIRYATRLDGEEDKELRVHEFRLVCKHTDGFDMKYFEQAKQLFIHNPNLRYVGAYKSSSTPFLNQYDLHRNDPYFSLTALTRMISRGKPGESLRDLYDQRLGKYAERFLINEEGYVIPECYITTTNDDTDEIPISNKVLVAHSMTKDNSWNPYVLSPFLNKSPVEGHSVDYDIYNKQRKIYYRLKAWVDNMEGTPGRIAGIILRKIYRLAKNVLSVVQKR